MLVVTYRDQADTFSQNAIVFSRIHTTQQLHLFIRSLHGGLTCLLVGNAGRKTTVEANLKAGKHPL
jgi:hypothetical protein